MRDREKKDAELKFRVEQSFRDHLDAIVAQDPEQTLSRIIRESVLAKYPMTKTVRRIQPQQLKAKAS
jgi:hypothetical protein